MGRQLEFGFEPLSGDERDYVGLIWQADEHRWLDAGTYKPVDKDEYPELISFAEQDLQRIRRAEEIADEWYEAYLLSSSTCSLAESASSIDDGQFGTTI